MAHRSDSEASRLGLNLLLSNHCHWHRLVCYDPGNYNEQPPRGLLSYPFTVLVWEKSPGEVPTTSTTGTVVLVVCSTRRLHLATSRQVLNDCTGSLRCSGIREWGIGRSRLGNAESTPLAAAHAPRIPTRGAGGASGIASVGERFGESRAGRALTALGASHRALTLAVSAATLVGVLAAKNLEAIFVLRGALFTSWISFGFAGLVLRASSPKGGAGARGGAILVAYAAVSSVVSSYLSLRN